MENRWSQRTPMQLNLIIHYGPLGLIRATSKDVSAKGMFIETGRIVLSPDETIELTFSYPSTIEGVTYSLPANIVHSSEQGSGIEFINRTLEELEADISDSLKRVASY